MIRSICTKAAAALSAASILAGCGAAPGGEDDAPGYRTSTIERRDIVRTVEATGTVTPRNSSKGIPVGAQVNGKLVKLFVDYNSTVTNGQVVALIDPLVYEANHKSAVAQLHAAEANVEVRKAALASAKAELALAEKTFARKKTLVERKTAPVADFDAAEEALARAKASVDSARASLSSAQASVEQARAAADKARTDLGYCTIVSPVDGIVIDRKVEEGETVVSSMNAVPVLTIAEDLKKVWVEATVPEADVGDIKTGQKVTFTADAYRRRFEGRVIQIRRAATTTNNVVTFPVMIEADNPGEMLFPGMTATLSIETARVENVPAVAAAAFRFRPREDDAARVAGEIPKGRKIWLEPADPDGAPEPVKASEGVSDDRWTEVVCDNAAALVGREAIVGYSTKRDAAAAAADKTNPFKPKFPARNKNKGTAPEPKAK